MLYFIIPLKGKDVSRNWDDTLRLLKETIQSITAQTNRDFRVIVACHDSPNIRVPSDFVDFCTVPFPALTSDVWEKTPERRLFDMHSDKGRKLIFGLEIARKKKADYVMFVDADDLISNRICETIHRNFGIFGYELYHGYRMDESNPLWLYRRSQFSQECGTSHIIATNHAPFPEKVDYNLDLEDYFIRRYVNHAYVASSMKLLSKPLKRLPFYGAIYKFNTEAIFSQDFRNKESLARKLARRFFRGEKVTSQKRHEFFGIPT